MTDLIEQVEKKKPGPAAKPKVDYDDYVALKAKVDSLEVVIAKMGHQTGTPNLLFLENNLVPYSLNKSDFTKYA